MVQEQTSPPPPESGQTLKEQLYLAGSPRLKHHLQQGNEASAQELNLTLPVAAKASKQPGSLSVSPTKSPTGRPRWHSLHGQAATAKIQAKHTHAQAAVSKAEVGPVVPVQAGSPMQVPPGNASYLRLLEQLRQHPETQDFVYLRRVISNPSLYNPYNLEVVPFGEADPEELYTLSSQGVTQHCGVVRCEFTSLAQWGREMLLFNGLQRLHIFGQYKLWKNLKSWYQNVRQTKIARAKAAMEKFLFTANLVLQNPLAETRAVCSKLGTLQLQHLAAGQTYTLQSFLTSQHAWQQEVALELEDCNDAAAEATAEACQAALAALAERLEQFHSKQEVMLAKTEKTLAPLHEAAGRNITLHTAGLHSTQKAQETTSKFDFTRRGDHAQEFSYTQGAARRTELRRLQAYVKMSDYMVCDALQEVLTSSVRHLLERIADPSAMGKDRALQSEASTAQQLGQAGQVGDEELAGSQPATSCIFEVDILLALPGLALEFSPSVGDFKHAMEVLLASWMEELANLKRLWDMDEITSLITTDGDQLERPTPLADLMDTDNHRNLVAALQQALMHAFAEAEEYKQSYSSFLEVLQRDQAIDLAAMEAAYSAQWRKDLLAPQAAPVADAEATGQAAPGSDSQLQTAAIAASASPVPGQSGAVQKEQQHQGGVLLHDFHDLMEDLRKQLADIHAVNDTNYVGVIQVNSAHLKAALLPAPSQLLAELSALLPRCAALLYSNFIAHVHDATSRLTARTTTVEEYVEKLSFMVTLKAHERDFDESYAEVQAIYELVAEYALPVAALEMAAFHTLVPDYTAMRHAIDEVESAQDEQAQSYALELATGAEAIKSALVEIRNAAQAETVLNLSSDQESVVRYLTDLKQRVAEQQAEAARIVKHQKFLKVPEAVNDELGAAAEEVELRLLLWVSLREWEELSSRWRSSPFMQLDVASMEESVARFHKSVQRMDRGLPPNAVSSQLRDHVDVMRAALPVVQALRNPSLKDRHWHKTAAILRQPVHIEPIPTFSDLLELKVVEHVEELTAVSVEATQEAALEELLARVTGKWANIEFAVHPYKDTKDVFILGGVEDVITVLEDSMLTMSTILASRFVTGIKHDVERVDRQLRLFSETLDAWVTCQKSWMYLECIFAAPDIQRQLPHEGKAFAQVDKHFRETMRRTHDRPNALLAVTSPGLLEVFQKDNEVLEKIAKSLEDYLETKRMAFPRFYFLSNEELIEILAQSKNPQAVQPHMGKCFDGIRRLEFGDDAKSIDIFGMVSGEGERVSLGKSLKARGNIEAWLTSVEQNMISSLRRLARSAYQSYPTTTRTEWVLQQPAQLVLVVSQIFWCVGVEKCLTAPDPGSALPEFLKTNVGQLQALTALVRGDLTELSRRVLAALITIDVHARDIVDSLIKGNVQDVSDFAWQMQLRYTWSDSADDVVVRQVNARFLYAYEYLGAQPRLVVTPMTDRCYMTLTGALHLKLGGAPAGPAGTGKTETTKDLAKGLGINCVVFNCGENLDFKFMGKFFAGLAQCGAWACFDEFNRIDIEVLSVVAQQLLTLQNALKAELVKFNFEGRTIRLVPTCGVFITMNPGYAGRTELPDNLKALFRPMAMMIPDYALVAEVMLFSEGFEDSKTLARKMVKLYKLASEQLSQQDHYDFGMRAVKSVLVMAGSLRRANPELSEDVVLIRAMRDSNVPKFLAADLELFQNIISDLFPGVEVPYQSHAELEKSVLTLLKQRNLQAPAPFVTKVLQLFETLNVRFGVMLVGPTGSGKSEVHKTLQGAMTRMREVIRHPSEVFQTITSYTFNPKCVKMGELYGEYNQLTNEWKDGLASTIIRSAVADTTPARKWVVFDGPVDAIWIENMNTVLDDNCTLCLPNGERLKLNAATMRMLFEVSDLSVASPATVSRCGMVYVPPETVGWRSYIQSWASQGLPDALKAESKAFLLNLFEQHVDSGLAFVRSEGREHITSVDIGLVTSLAQLLQALLAPERGISYGKKADQLEPILMKLFAFAYTWALGGNLAHTCHAAFDTHVRDVFGDAVGYPTSGTVFDYYVDLKGVRGSDLRSWSDSTPSFQYDKRKPYFGMLVPTLDTVRYSFLLEACLDVGRSVLFTGTTGVGKSVITVDALEHLCTSKGLLPHTINFSAQTTSLDTQLLIEGKLDKKRKTKLGAPPGKRIVFFVDDVNMPARETFGAQPPVELLRQFQDYKGFYDRDKLFWKDIEDTMLVAACAPPGGGRQPISSRFVRHFTQLCIPPPSDGAIKTIFTAIFAGFLGDFPPDFKTLCGPIVNGSIETYNRISTELLPTPAKSHYTFSLRDLSKVFQGMLMISPKNCATKETLVRLWVHESLRVFHDRLISAEDKNYFKGIIRELAAKNLGNAVNTADIFAEGKPLMFGDFLKFGADREDRVYEEVTDMAKVLKLMDAHLEDFSATSTKSMTLVFFMDAVEHIARISRMLRQPRGNAMLVGVSGSGKQSLTRFAAAMGGFKCFQLELRRGYGMTEFREDLKKLYRTAGVDGQPVVFLLTDNQITNEGLLEDVNNLLNSGEVPGMFTQEEKDQMVGGVRDWVDQQGGNTSKDLQGSTWKGAVPCWYKSLHCCTSFLHLLQEGCYAAFINRVRDNLHVVLAMSPVGDVFRARCRKFPSLINCCTIDWFTEWPADALLSVSMKFLGPVELGGDQVKAAICSMCADIHTSVSTASERFHAQLRRRYYTTPKSYLDLITLYISLLKDKRTEYSEARERLLNGLNKLRETNLVVEKMQADLNKLTPVLEEKTQATAQLLEQVTRDQKEAEIVKAVVSQEETEVKAKAGETGAIAAEAQADLDQALPALQAAVDSLHALNKNDITEIKSMLKPPPLVMMTMEAVCILKQEKPDWDTAKRVLSDTGFMKSLLEFDKDNIPDAVIKRLKKYIDAPEFNPEAVAKQSRAAQSLCMWARAMDTYNRVSKAVAPKRAKLANAQAQLAEANASLQAKQQALQAVVDKVAALQQLLADTEQEQVLLKTQAETTQKRLNMAGKLTSALSEEGVRWSETATQIQAKTDLLVGDVFLSAACIAYYGAFTGQFRQDLVDGWIARCKELAIPVSGDCTLRGVLASPVEVREWRAWGLPTDDVSIDNGILVTRGKRWPLMIDPQGQANNWVKNMEVRSNIKVVKLTNPLFLRVLENAIRLGNPVLIEDVGESIDPALEPVLQKQVFKQGGRSLIRLGDSDVDYDPNFRLYLTTKQANPHYLPEVCIKVTLINFTVTSRGLEDQLLGDVVRKERPDLEETRDRLVVSISTDKRQLKDLEDKILRLLKEAKGNILDDEQLINTLNNSKQTSGMVQARVKEAEETERSINEAREHYRPAATRGSILYFSIADLALISPMYQNSLAFFAKLFNYCIDSSEKAPDVPTRLQHLSAFVTSFIFNTVQRGLFEQHKLLFAFLVGTAIARNAGDISQAEWSFLLRGPTGLPVSKSADTLKPPAWASPTQWASVLSMDSMLSPFKGLADSICDEAGLWEKWVRHEELHRQTLPAGWDADLTTFQRLLLVRVLREEKLLLACQHYIGQTLGSEFTEPRPWQLDDVFPDTTAATPIIFILSSGADPTAMLQRFAEKKGMVPGERLHMISLGQGQGPVAEMLISQAVKAGDWVCLQNCHLAKSWMLRLEAAVEDLAKSDDVSPDFRLWLTSMPSPVFPVLVLQSGVKLTNEPPRGVKANVARTYNDMTDVPFESCHAKPTAWKKLLFSLSFFHAVVQERRKFGPLGWNIKYAFNQSDLECSMMNLMIFLGDQEQIPWSAMEYVIGQINYGGRVTDDLDRRCLMSVLRKYITPHVLSEDYKFVPGSGVYYSPPPGSLEQYREYIQQLPPTEAPEVFGMPPNANIIFQLQETRQLVDTVLSIQPRLDLGTGGASPDETVAASAASILSGMPPLLSNAEAHPSTFARPEAGQLSSLAVVLGQEMDRCNRLSQAMQASLTELQKAIKGLVVMSGDLELVYLSILDNQVPQAWKQVSSPSLQPLGSWMEHYHRRVAFMRGWLTQGMPQCFWLPGFSFPQGLLTGVLQTHARKYSIPIDTLSFTFKVTQWLEPGQVTEVPQDGLLIDGLWIDGARWNMEHQVLDDAKPGVMYSQLPVTEFRPVKEEAQPANQYSIPVYKTSERAGALSTTGQSTNFVLEVNLPIREGTDADYWILQGVALLTMLDT